MKVFVVLFACLVASAYSRQVVIRYINPEDTGIQQPLEDPTPVETVQQPLVDPTPVSPPRAKGSFFSNIFSKAGDLAADTADTAGRIAKGVVEVPATLVSKTVSEAGRGAAEALRETGNAAAQAVEHVEHGIDNMFSGWDK